VTEGRSELEASLAEIDRKLRELQRELQAVTTEPERAPAAREPPPEPPPPRPEPPPAEPPPAPPPPSPEPPPPPPEPPRSRLLDDTAARVSELSRRIDELQRLGEELEAATRALQEEFARSAGAAATPTWSGEVVVRAGPFRDIASLGEFERAMGEIPGAEEAYVRSFAGDRALIEVRLSGPVDLVAEMRRALPWEVRLVESGTGELEISLGS
jgi:uncharacterized coiled-coil protein SlyX